MTILKPPKYVAIDSSILNKTADAWDGESRPSFDLILAENGWILFLCASHIFEMIAYGNREIVKKRLRFIRAFRMLAWLKPIKTADEFIGDTIELLQLEIDVLIHNPSLTAEKTVEIVRSKSDLIVIGSGSEALSAIDSEKDNLDELRNAVIESQKEARERVSLVQMNALKNIKINKRDSFEGSFRKLDEIEEYTHEFKNRLAQEMEKRGDRKIDNYSQLVDTFIKELFTEDINPEGYNNEPLKLAEQLYGFPVKKIVELKTSQRVREYYKFLSWLKKSKPESSEEERLRIIEESLPCWIVSRALNRHRQTQGKVQGSTENDERFVWLSLYCDLTFVDKQTMDNCRRAAQKDILFKSLVGKLETASDGNMALEKMKIVS